MRGGCLYRLRSQFAARLLSVASRQYGGAVVGVKLNTDPVEMRPGGPLTSAGCMNTLVKNGPTTAGYMDPLLTNGPTTTGYTLGKIDLSVCLMVFKLQT